MIDKKMIDEKVKENFLKSFSEDMSCISQAKEENILPEFFDEIADIMINNKSYRVDEVKAVLKLALCFKLKADNYEKAFDILASIYGEKRTSDEIIEEWFCGRNEGKLNG